MRFTLKRLFLLVTLCSAFFAIAATMPYWRVGSFEQRVYSGYGDLNEWNSLLEDVQEISSNLETERMPSLSESIFLEIVRDPADDRYAYADIVLRKHTVSAYEREYLQSYCKRLRTDCIEAEQRYNFSKDKVTETSASESED